MRNIQHTPSGRKVLLLRLGAVFLTLFTTVGLLSQAAFAQTTYVITDGDRVVVHTTYATDPAEVLSEAGLELGADDTFTTQPGSNVSEITVNRLQLVKVNWKGQTLEVATYGSTVSAILAQLGIPTEDNLRIAQDLQAETYDGMVIDVIRLTYETLEFLREEAFETIYCSDTSLAPGEEKTIVEGKPGSVRCTALVTYEDGREVSRSITEEVVLTAPVTAIVARGIDRSGKSITLLPDETEPAPAAQPEESRPAKTEPSQTRPTEPEPEETQPPVSGENTFTTASGEVITYVKKLTVEATAYSCEGYEGITATGTVARYGAIAVDPTVIPYGTRMYIVSDDGVYIYGYATAEDCGGGIKGNKIDLYFDTVDECWEFGRRSCTVYILG
ncbi:MAG: 3D domain-containing protein [Clostridiales bacterium]|nr:3D domain-containing protein [Clostridiales bacterium]